MCRAITFSALAFLALASPLRAGPFYLSSPVLKPLAILIRESDSIHELLVEEVEAGSVTPRAEVVSFNPVVALKGQPIEAPFRFVRPLDSTLSPRAGDRALVFLTSTGAAMHVGGRWLQAGKSQWTGGVGDWPFWDGGEFSVTFEGSTEALKEHVVAILAGRERIVTARSPAEWRLWRIKAGPSVTEFVLSDESPDFVGWGTGDPREVANLTRALRDGPSRERITAAGDLAHLGAAAKPALPALRQALDDADHNVVLAAAGALSRLDPGDDRNVAGLQTCLGHKDAEVRAGAARELAALGPRASAALPALLKALGDEDKQVRAIAADAVGKVAPSPPPREVVDALAGLVRAGKEDEVRSAAIRSLAAFGPHSWPAVSALREGLSVPPEGARWDFASDAFALLARFDPPPVGVLTEIIEDARSPYSTREQFARQLGALGPRARSALPSLRRLVREFRRPEEKNARLVLEVAEAIVDIDPEGGPALVVPMLLELVKADSGQSLSALALLGRCGEAAVPLVRDLLTSLPQKGDVGAVGLVALTPLVGPEHGDLLPMLRQPLIGDWGDDPMAADVLRRLGQREEAVALAVRCLLPETYRQSARAARWLGERGGEAQAAEPALRRALGRATGAYRARIALTLWRVRGPERAGSAADRALAALDDLLGVACEGQRPAGSPHRLGDLGRLRREYITAEQEDKNVGAAVGLMHSRLQAGSDTVVVLAESLRDASPYVRLAAATALSRADPAHPDTVPTLRRLLDRYPHFLFYAADTLADLGPAAAPLAPLVRPLLRHPDDGVCRAAKAVLRRIDPKAATEGWGSAGVPDAVPENLNPLWDDLASADALRADLAAWRLAGAGTRAVALLRQRLRPPAVPSDERLARLVVELDHDDFAIRQRASSELSDALEVAAPALRRALAVRDSPELRARIESLLAGPEGPRTPEQRLGLRAVRLLGEIGGADAREVLKALSEGDGRLTLTREAAETLRLVGRL